MTLQDLYFVATSAILVALWFWLVSRIKHIERRLDQEYDHFRYIDRGTAWVGPKTLDWLFDFLRKFPAWGYDDPILDRLVARLRTGFTIWVSAITIWLFGAAVVAAIS